MHIRTVAFLIALVCILFLGMPTMRDASPAAALLDLTPYQQITLKVYLGGENVDMDLEEYVRHVVAAEMPMTFADAALSAQAVAARTYAVSKTALYGGTGCASHPNSDVCGNYRCCQAYASDADLQTRWGEEYSANSKRLNAAVQVTSGKILTYEGQPILALYHAASGGHTEDVESVFSESLPYLRGVESSGEADASAKSVSTKLTYSALNKALKSIPGATAKAPKDIEILSHLDSGRVKTIRIGSAELSGVQVRQLLDLRSANFSVKATKKNIVFQTVGSGHGVGMSQYGADAMAINGADYETILTWYYTGATLKKLY